MKPITQKHRIIVDDPLRPIYHFTAPTHWLNDPNGLIHWQGRYHLFYQHNPHAITWDTMHWGHAVSDDLVHWHDLPLALAPTANSYDDRGIWSGCIVDDNGIATMLYTGASGEDYQHQHICIATSQDDYLLHWQKYDHNPLMLAVPPELKTAGFRDPYVWRQDNQWKMVIGAGALHGAEYVLLFEGDTLYEWRFVGTLIQSEATNDHIYECPNFFKLGDKWVLLVSVMPTSHVEYYVGLFWNNHFIPESHGVLAQHPFYAPFTFEDPLGRRIMMGWLQETSLSPIRNWSGAISSPIELMLLDNNQLVLTPIREMLDDHLTDKYRQQHLITKADFAAWWHKSGSSHSKCVIADEVSQVIFVDGSIIEYFAYPQYAVKRFYSSDEGLSWLQACLDFPIKRAGIWSIRQTI